MKSIFSKKDSILTITTLVLLAAALRAIFLNIETFDMTKYVLNWYRSLYQVGTVETLAGDSYNYTPTYLYLLDIISHLRWIPDLVAIKLVSIFFDFFAAAAVYRIVKLMSGSAAYGWAGFLVALFLPTVVVESSLWGQCDIIYTSFLLWSLYFLLKEKGLLAVSAFGVALAFKLQAIFFAPLLVLLLFKGKVKFWHFFTIPVIYLIAMLPAWFAGRPLQELLTIYIRQTGTFDQLSMRAANPYIFLSNRNFDLKLAVGFAIAFLCLLAWFLFRLMKQKTVSPRTILFEAALLTFFIPFILPRMHERYFFAGCVFLMILAFLDKDFFIPTVLAQVSSLLSYIPYLTDWTDAWVKIAAVINGCILVMLIPLAAKIFLNENEQKPDEKSKQPYGDFFRI